MDRAALIFLQGWASIRPPPSPTSTPERDTVVRGPAVPPDPRQSPQGPAGAGPSLCRLDEGPQRLLKGVAAVIRVSRLQRKRPLEIGAVSPSGGRREEPSCGQSEREQDFLLREALLREGLGGGGYQNHDPGKRGTAYFPRNCLPVEEMLPFALLS